jgi:hypothetical protein
MSKVNVEHTTIKDSFFVSAATITTSWKPGMIFKLDTTGNLAALATNSQEAMFVAIDDPTALSAPPTGSLVTGIYGGGTRFIIDHTPEVAAADATRAYESDVAPAAVNADLFCSANGKWTTNPPPTTGSVLGKLMKVPAAANNYNLEIKLVAL